LVDLVVWFLSSNLSTFCISCSLDINNSFVLDVNNLVVLELPKLPPSRSNWTFSINVPISIVWHSIPWVLFRLNCLWLLVKDPHLPSIAFIQFPDLKPLVDSWHFNNSVRSHSRNDEEWSVHLETEVFVKSLCHFFDFLVNVDKFPLLRLRLVSRQTLNILCFLIFSLINIKDLVALDI